MKSLAPTLKNVNHQFNCYYYYYYCSNAILVLNIQERNDMNYIFCLFALFTVPFDPSLTKGLTVGYNLLSCAVIQQSCFCL